jgi:hypothetical protein
MKASSNQYRKALVLFILVTLLANEGLSLMAGARFQALSHTEVYQYTESTPAIPLPLGDVQFKLLIGFAVALSFALHRIISRKVFLQVVITVSVRNPFYRHVTIHAP